MGLDAGCENYPVNARAMRVVDGLGRGQVRGRADETKGRGFRSDGVGGGRCIGSGIYNSFHSHQHLPKMHPMRNEFQTSPSSHTDPSMLYISTPSPTPALCTYPSFPPPPKSTFAPLPSNIPIPPPPACSITPPPSSPYTTKTARKSPHPTPTSPRSRPANSRSQAHISHTRSPTRHPRTRVLPSRPQQQARRRKNPARSRARTRGWRGRRLDSRRRRRGKRGC